MATKKIGIIMNGVTGRMGTNQHLVRSIAAIRAEGGVLLSNGDRLLPDPILVGRNEEKLAKLAGENSVERYSTDLEAALADDYNQIYFDSQTTNRREASIKQAIEAGKHIYCEKPTATSLEGSLELARLARENGVKNGVVQDKLFLPGLLKLKHLIDSGYFGDILSVKLDFGYWVFEGDWQEAQRPSWNYRAEDGGGIIVDMFAHWRYVIDHLFGEIDSLTCLGATHIPYRVDEAGNSYKATADDAAYAIFALKNGIVVQANSSWTTRVDRDDLVTFQVDGTLGSAVAGLRDCKVQHRVTTPKPVWNPDIPNAIDFRSQWETLPENRTYDNGFKIQWELFLKHIEEDTAFPWDLLEGAKGTQLSDLGLEAWREKKWVTVPSLEV
ncbi:Predicted dehydrogenase [Terribacillus saccharophilus]|uniref:Predicted dehydrogenase n=1 Tax=Terribacillus saccharophilus TaxID=361277 RepID=A0AAX2EI24_9BACI|nr:Gfo/Idh/MocA family oxidoreductase [Terribacillus saccharophilus]MCM3227299.1 Gfo/Idh/MocA family oxidoreductase [Terribacillus saccharophilus]MEC0283957.1 Gfo/Idh/MocA family oxidoreductase [Terribacillus saccharophilus]MEC0289850.1 Gfo/Idh/MocA family oxidoreductase [Terribacillus saccharophilus]SEN77446.1 Predicted dehydrogenase [Terribacillus saccharophilus]